MGETEINRSSTNYSYNTVSFIITNHEIRDSRLIMCIYKEHDYKMFYDVRCDPNK